MTNKTFLHLYWKELFQSQDWIKISMAEVILYEHNLLAWPVQSMSCDHDVEYSWKIINLFPLKNYFIVNSEENKKGEVIMHVIHHFLK